MGAGNSECQYCPWLCLLVSGCLGHLSYPVIELPDLCGMSGTGEVSRVNKYITVRYGSVDVRGEGVSVRHTDEPELNNPCYRVARSRCSLPCPLELQCLAGGPEASSHLLFSSSSASSLSACRSARAPRSPRRSCLRNCCPSRLFSENASVLANSVQLRRGNFRNDVFSCIS